MSDVLFPSNEYLDALSNQTIPLRMNFVSSGMRLSDLPPSSLPEIAIVGRSNVEKSSVLNFLAGQKQLARTSSTPGRTQTINLFATQKNEFQIADLPGYGYAKSQKSTQGHWESALVEYFLQREGLVGVLFLIDIRREVNEEDQNLCGWLLQQDLVVLAVRTKLDKVNKNEALKQKQKQAEALGVMPGMIIQTSSEKKEGLQKILLGISGLIRSCMP